jgi:hypothetical protein
VTKSELENRRRKREGEREDEETKEIGRRYVKINHRSKMKKNHT